MLLGSTPSKVGHGIGKSELLILTHLPRHDFDAVYGHSDLVLYTLTTSGSTCHGGVTSHTRS